MRLVIKSKKGNYLSRFENSGDVLHGENLLIQFSPYRNKAIEFKNEGDFNRAFSAIKKILGDMAKEIKRSDVDVELKDEYIKEIERRKKEKKEKEEKEEEKRKKKEAEKKLAEEKSENE